MKIKMKNGVTSIIMEEHETIYCICNNNISEVKQCFLEYMSKEFDECINHKIIFPVTI